MPSPGFVVLSALGLLGLLGCPDSGAGDQDTTESSSSGTADGTGQPPDSTSGASIDPTGAMGCSATAPSPDDVGLGIVSAGSAEGTDSSDAKTDDPVPAATETSDGGTGASDTSGGTFEDETGQPRFDLGTQPDLGPQVPDASTKVDVLFVIDNSQSMANEQANLVAAFPGFANGLQTALESAESYHVGIVTSDDSYSGNGGTCQGVGHLVNRPSYGAHASGYRWFDEAAPDLASMFACEASVGTGGDNDERQMDAAMRAIGPMYATPGDCNEFFIREDALLVIVFITDEPDRDSSGSPQDWFDAIVDAKGSRPRAEVRTRPWERRRHFSSGARE